MRVAIIGGGAAGFFAAIHVRMNYPDAQVTIFEKSAKVLAKVKISGGGRCNVTNGEQNSRILSEAYPRGGRQLRKLFGTFGTKETMEWFESRGVPLVIQEDNCVFPVSQNSESIIQCFLNECRLLGVDIKTGHVVTSINPTNDQIELEFRDQALSSFEAVIVTTGGSPKKKGLEWLEVLGHEIETPVPSLFTFNMPNESITDLMGVVVPEAQAWIPGTKLKASGPLLITHWGMSGPAILKLSAFGARILADQNYQFQTKVNWCNENNQDTVREKLKELVGEHSGKRVRSIRPYFLPDRLWKYLVQKAGISEDKTWQGLTKKDHNRLIELLTNDTYQVSGKTTFKEEFVTCGGVSLKSIDIKSMESKAVPNLYFAGEVTDMDGITGGYNFQAAWTTAFIAAQLKGMKDE